MARARIADVARRAGVSSRTVTRVLRGGAKVAPETKERIDSALRDLRYSPHPIAQALKMSKTMLVGVIVQGLITEILVKKLIAIERAASERGYRILLGITDSDFTQERRYIQDYAGMCDGIILFVDWPVGASEESLEILRAHHQPYVLIDGSPKDGSCVCLDRGAGVREALQQLHGRYAGFAYLSDMAPVEKDKRYRAFRDFLHEVGKSARTERLAGDEEPFEIGYRNGDHVAQRPGTLVCCQSDRMAMGLLKRLTELGARVPEDVGIVGFDNDSYTPFTCKALSTIDQPAEEVAAAAVGLLVRQIEGDGGSESRGVRTAFVSRDTTL